MLWLRLVFVVVDNLVGGWWLVAVPEGLLSMKQQIHALTNRKTEKKGTGHHSFSVRSLARNTMISEMMIGFKFKELYVWEYDMLINSALNNKQQTTNDISQTATI